MPGYMINDLSTGAPVDVGRGYLPAAEPPVDAGSGSPPAAEGPASGLTPGVMMLGFSIISSAIGAYYSARSSQLQYESQAMTLKFQQAIAELNRNRAELTAQDILRAGEKEIGKYTLRAGQQKGATRAAMAARGGALNVGSNMEIRASQDIISEIDKLTIESNTVRAAYAARTQSTNYQTESTLLGVSAQNAMASARSISPGMAVGANLLSGAGPYMSYLK